MEQYSLVEKIGEGSYGRVYRVTKNNEVYALKIGKKGRAICNEIDALKQFQHPRIPKLIDFGLDENYAFFVMPLLRISLIHLYQVLPGYFTSRTVAAIGRSLIDILMHIHRCGFIYRDMKPENIMFGYDNNIHLIDFGMCCRYIENKLHILEENSKVFMGTAKYASVWTHRGVVQSRRDDMESLGYVLIFLLKGKLPWAEKRRSEREVGELKQAVTPEELCGGCESQKQWVSFFKHTHHMILGDVVVAIKAREILESRGHPTVEVDFVLESGVIRSSVPSGASKGKNERPFVCDGDVSYNGLSVKSVVNCICDEGKEMLKKTFNSQDEFDSYLIDREKINGGGVGFTLPLSVCFMKLLSKINRKPCYSFIKEDYSLEENNKIPTLYFNMINGGVHSGNNLACQETMVAFETKTVSESLECASLFYDSLKTVITMKYGGIFRSVGDEGGFAPPISTTYESIELVIEASKLSNTKDIKIALDFAANSFYRDGQYQIDGKHLTTNQLIDYYTSLVKEYPNISLVEDPFQEDDHIGWKNLMKAVGSRIKIVSDDLTVTDSTKIDSFTEQGLCNTVLIKPNQIGTVTQSIKAIKVARNRGCEVMVSHRSAETEDTFVCHLAVGINAEYAKFGAPCRGERIAKYNEMLRIEEESLEE